TTTTNRAAAPRCIRGCCSCTCICKIAVIHKRGHVVPAPVGQRPRLATRTAARARNPHVTRRSTPVGEPSRILQRGHPDKSSSACATVQRRQAGAGMKKDITRREAFGVLG